MGVIDPGVDWTRVRGARTCVKDRRARSSSRTDRDPNATDVNKKFFVPFVVYDQRLPWDDGFA